MKKLYVLFILVIIFTKAHAQWVTIPDANFAAFLQQNYPQCMNGNQMDTTCSAIVNETYINCINKNISDLTGIVYFKNLYNLWCSQNNLTSLPSFPSSLRYLFCQSNQLSSLNNLPDSLTHLTCGDNQITFINSLPFNLKFLQCSNNQLTSLPSLPNTLESLNCQFNQLSFLPSLPNNLQILNCNFNQITSLPVLPNSLLNLECNNNQLSNLPSLPLTLQTLYSSSNQLFNLPSLPNSLHTLHCSLNQLTFLPQLPNSLKQIDCYSNQLTNFPLLPSSLVSLNCSANQIASLPTLPSSLNYLNCSSNQLLSLPNLPDSLKTLNCTNNQISALPLIPNTLQILWCGNNAISFLSNFPNSLYSIRCNNNQLINLPALPDSLISLYVNDNINLTCLPQLKKITNLDYNNTNILCLPNYGTVLNSSPILSSTPLCDIFNNSNNCDVYWNISGKVYNDINNNCIDDTSEQGLSNLKLQLFQNSNLIQQVYSGSEGLYSFDTDTGTFTYTVDTTDLPIHVTCPTSGFHTSFLTPLDSMDYNMDFAMQCKPGFDVGVKSITRTSGQFFPGNTATVKIGAGDMASFYGLTCASGLSGSVIVNFTGPVSFISEAPGALVPSVVGNTLTYTIPDFGLINFNSDFRIILQTDTTAQAGNQVCFNVNVTPTTGDNDVNNNSMQHCFSVVNSFDPNAKEVYPEGGITVNQEWLAYTIHFQNTGNAPSQNIYILDTLDNNLIPETFTLLSYSHEPLTQLFGNVVKFNFPNINLPDSTNDEPNSHGFVQYKIKITPGLPIGTVISNIAYNFFDFNPPVATNIVSNTVGITAISENNNNVELIIYPNPTKEELNISFTLESNKEIKIELFNSLGHVVKVISSGRLPAGKNEINFSVADLPIGVYHLKFSAGDKMVVKRVVKM